MSAQPKDIPFCKTMNTLIKALVECSWELEACGLVFPEGMVAPMKASEDTVAYIWEHTSPELKQLCQNHFADIENLVRELPEVSETDLYPAILLYVYPGAEKYSLFVDNAYDAWEVYQECRDNTHEHWAGRYYTDHDKFRLQATLGKCVVLAKIDDRVMRALATQLFMTLFKAVSPRQLHNDPLGYSDRDQWVLQICEREAALAAAAEGWERNPAGRTFRVVGLSEWNTLHDDVATSMAIMPEGRVPALPA